MNNKTKHASEQTAQQQEPVANIRTWHKNGEQHAELWNWDKGIETLPDGDHDLYTSPPASKPWAELSAEEMAALVKKYRDAPVALVAATEAKLKEKNTCLTEKQ